MVECLSFCRRIEAVLPGFPRAVNADVAALEDRGHCLHFAQRPRSPQTRATFALCHKVPWAAFLPVRTPGNRRLQAGAASYPWHPFLPKHTTLAFLDETADFVFSARRLGLPFEGSGAKGRVASRLWRVDCHSM